MLRRVYRRVFWFWLEGAVVLGSEGLGCESSSAFGSMNPGEMPPMLTIRCQGRMSYQLVLAKTNSKLGKCSLDSTGSHPSSRLKPQGLH